MIKKILSGLAATSVALISLGALALPANAAESDFPDAALRACVNEVVKGDFSTAKLATVEGLECNNDNNTFKVASWEGIQKLPNLTYFKSNGNHADDLTPFNGLPKLQDISFNDGTVNAVDERPAYNLSELTNSSIEYMSFVNSDFTKSFAEVDGPANLRTVDFTNSFIKGVSVDNAEAKNIVEAYPNAGFYNLDMNSITDVSFFNGATNFSASNQDFYYVSNLNYRALPVLAGSSVNLPIVDENGNAVTLVKEYGDANANGSAITFGQTEGLVRFNFSHDIPTPAENRFAGSVDYEVFATQADLDAALERDAMSTRNLSISIDGATAALKINDPLLQYQYVTPETLNMPQKYRYVITVDNKDGVNPLDINSLKAFSSNWKPSGYDWASTTTTQVIADGVDITSVSSANNDEWQIAAGATNTYVVEALFPKANMVSRDADGNVNQFGYNNKIVMNVERVVNGVNTETNFIWRIYNGTAVFSEPIFDKECEVPGGVDENGNPTIGVCMTIFAFGSNYEGTADDGTTPPVVVVPPTNPPVEPPVVTPPTNEPPVVTPPVVEPPVTTDPPVVDKPSTPTIIKNGGENEVGLYVGLAAGVLLLLGGAAAFIARKKTV